MILRQDFENKILNYSKQLSEKIREKLRPIIEQQAISFASLKSKCLALNPNSGRGEN
jgi:ribonuclease HII